MELVTDKTAGRVNRKPDLAKLARDLRVGANALPEDDYLHFPMMKLAEAFDLRRGAMRKRRSN